MVENGLSLLKSKKPLLIELPANMPEVTKIKEEMGLW
jgi:hypothetical protein